MLGRETSGLVTSVVQWHLHWWRSSSSLIPLCPSTLPSSGCQFSSLVVKRWLFHFWYPRQTQQWWSKDTFSAIWTEQSSHIISQNSVAHPQNNQWWRAWNHTAVPDNSEFIPQMWWRGVNTLKTSHLPREEEGTTELAIISIDFKPLHIVCFSHSSLISLGEELYFQLLFDFLCFLI